MKALILEEYNTLVYKEVPDPKPGPSDVLIQIKACGICGSDVHGMDGSSGRRIPPIIMGHEASGVVAEIGSDVENFQPGDRVTFDSTISCNHCYYCRKGRINLCDNRKVVGVSCEEYRFHGAFAEYVVVPDHIVYPLPGSVGFDQAALIEAVTIAMHAVAISRFNINDSVVIVGAGPIGLFILQVLKNSYCGKIAVVDMIKRRLKLAQKLGADVTFKADSSDLFAQVNEYTHGSGFELAFDAVGLSPTVNSALNMVRKGGGVTLVGNITPKVDFPLQKTVTREIAIFGSCASTGEYPAAIDFLSGNRINADILISKSAPLEEGARWFDRLYHKDPDLIKVVLNP